MVLDTTGSVIYAQNNILMRLRRQMTVVHLASTEQRAATAGGAISDGIRSRCCGAENFQPRSSETPRETVARCYPMLIAARQKSYETLAHCAVQVAELRGASEGAERSDNGSCRRTRASRHA